MRTIWATPVAALFACLSLNAYAGGGTTPVPRGDWEITCHYEGAYANGVAWPQGAVGLACRYQGISPSSIGTMRVTATWVKLLPTGYPAIAPETCTLRFVADASAALLVPVGPNGETLAVGSATVENGFDDTPTSNGGISETAHGVHYKTLPVHNGVATYNVPMTASAEGTYNGSACMGIASVQLAVTPANKSAQLVTPDLDTRLRDDGDLEADTVFELWYNLHLFLFEMVYDVDSNEQHFEWSASGAWTNYPYPSWPHYNIRVEWQGSGTSLSSSHYEYNPTYNFDYGYYGSYFLRGMTWVIEGSTPLYEREPDSDDTLALKLTDLGDNGVWDQTLHLKVHYPADNWEETTVQISGVGQVFLVDSQPCDPGSEVTISRVNSETTVVKLSIGIELPNVPIKLPFVNVAPTFTGNWEKEVSSEDSTNVQTHVTAPPGACRVDSWQRAKVDRHIGTVTTWNKRGKIQDMAPATWDDPTSGVMALGLTFFDSNGYWIRSADDFLRGWV
jgi:hypothetical protein